VAGLIWRQKWSWYLAGKHPIAGDYLGLGKPTPLLKGFSGWMEKGYEGVDRKADPQAHMAWRFWARGPNGELVCGMIKESRDNHGRRYPLMIVGAGPVAERSRHWDLLPYACRDTWKALETLGGRTIIRIQELKRRVAGIRFSEPRWDKLYRKRETEKGRLILQDGNQRTSGFMDKMNNIEGLARQDHFLVPLEVCEGEGELALAAKLLRLLKSRSVLEPAMVFIGGSETDRYLMCLKRPLMLEDFDTLWVSLREAS